VLFVDVKRKKTIKKPVGVPRTEAQKFSGSRPSKKAQNCIATALT
jgi:hypothetical protein